jgi:DNA-binding beta-propeller fold protein YncE
VRHMLPAGISGLLIVGLMAVPVAAQSDADRLDLPSGWRPEGVTALDGHIYAGSLGDGAIWIIDPGVPDSPGRLFAPGEPGRVTVGVDASADGQTIWAAGGRTGEIRAYDVDTGEWTTWGNGDSGFLNDVAATENAVYVTDSFVPQLLALPVISDEQRGPAAPFERIPLTGDLEYIDGAFNVNGIVAAPAGLIVVSSTLGALFRVDPETGETFAIDSGDVALRGGDGLELDGNLLYVVRNSANTVTVLRLDEALTSATLVAELTHDDFDTPTTAALIGDDLWVVNARFGAPAGADTEFWLTRLDAAAGEDD